MPERLNAYLQLDLHLRPGRAKRNSARWLAGHHVVIARVLRAHGDGRLTHPLSDRSTS